MSVEQNASLDILSTDTTTANSAIVLSDDRNAIVELDPDHPGFRDKAYRERRNLIAQIAVDYATMPPGSPVPDAPYSEEEHAVWRAVWEQMEPAHQKHACTPYLENLDRLQMSRERIPQLEEISERVSELSDFRLEPVGGLVHPKVFLSTLGKGVFLSTQYIRHHSTPLYTPEPDVVHEIIGHAGMLANPKFAELNRLMGEAAARTEGDDAVERLGRVYWYTIEFGVLKEDGKLKAYGAGLLSSFGELEAMSKAELRPFDVEAMQALPYDVTKYQPVLFCAESFDEMYTKMKTFLEGWAV